MRRSLHSFLSKWGLALLIVALGCAGLFLALLPTGEVHALPEYSAQTGEPCASCHLSPSGGGARGPRGQAWVGSGKPGQIPDLEASLEILGVHLEVDESLYSEVPQEIPPSAPLPLKAEEASELHRWLRSFEGN